MGKIIEFLNDYNISYWEHHSIVSNGYIGINCPFCNDHAKPYLGIRKDGNSLNSTCWRCGSHSAVDTVEALTGVTDKSEIYRIIKRYKGEGFSGYVPKEDNINRVSKVILPGSPKLIPSAKKYLEKRGFDPIYVFEKFGLHTTTHESPSYRIVFPFYFHNRIVSWTARDYSNESDLRYLSAKPEQEIIDHKSILYNIDNQKKGGNVLLVEGILDAVRTGGCATAGTSVTLSQIQLLKQYSQVFVMFDGSQDAIKKAYEVATILSSIGVSNEVLELEEGDDPDTAFKDKDELLYLKKELQLF